MPVQDLPFPGIWWCNRSWKTEKGGRGGGGGGGGGGETEKIETKTQWENKVWENEKKQKQKVTKRSLYNYAGAPKQLETKRGIVKNVSTW